MLKPIEDLPDGVVGVDAIGRVTANDYEQVLAPTLERSLERRAKVRFLYRLGPEFEGFSAAALWDDAKIGLRHRTEFERCAIVTDAKWIRAGIGLFRKLVPCPVQVFGNEHLRDARAWVSA